MATITIATTTVPNYQRSGSTASLRISTTEAFFSDGVEVPAASGSDFYKEIACTVASDTVTIPEFTLPSTTDSTNDTARYIAKLYDAAGTYVTTLMGGLEFFLDPVPTSTTWQAVMIANQAVRRRMPDTYYNANQVDLLLDDKVGVDTLGDYYTSVETDALLDAKADNVHTHAISDVTSLQTALDAKQDTLISGTNIKTVNGSSILGAGNLTAGSSTGGYAVRITPAADPTYGGNNVNHGYFFDATVLTNVTGVFLWEAWVMPDAGAEYVVSDGHGGAHKLLFGFGGGSPLSVSGNIWNNTGAAVQSFSSIDSVPAGTLHHICVMWDGSNISVFVDGVRSNTIAYTGDRGNTGSTGVLYVGGSDHSNFDGLIYRVRGFEGVIPFSTGSPAGYFIPERIFRASFRDSSSGVTYAASFLADYTSPAQIITDHSLGHDGATHPGVLSVGNDDGLFIEGLKNLDTADVPSFEVSTFEQSAYAGTPPSSTPPTALLFDEFRRQDAVPAWALNPTTAGRTTPTGQLWTADMGVLSEKMFIWANSSVSPEVSHVQADIDITFTNGSTAVFPDVELRRTDANNRLVVNIQNFGGPIRVVLTEVIAGAGNVVATSADIGATSWSTYRVIANGANVDVYRNGVLVIDNATTALTTGTIAKIYMNPLARLDKIEAYPPA